MALMPEACTCNIAKLPMNVIVPAESVTNVPFVSVRRRVATRSIAASNPLGFNTCLLHLLFLANVQFHDSIIFFV